jgi:hypothetical protein
MIDVPKELCEVYERKEIGQPVTLTGKVESFILTFCFDDFVIVRSIFSIRSKSFIMSLWNKNATRSNRW